jgi:hypothetical protein
LIGTIALALALLGPFAPARAATVSYSLELPTAATENPDATSLGGDGARFEPVLTGSLQDKWLSPWDAANSPLDPDDAGSVYSALLNNTGRTLVTATFDFGKAFNRLSLVRGSAGSPTAAFNANSLALFLNGNLVFHMADSPLADESLDALIALTIPSPGTRNSMLVTISGLRFDRMVIGADHRAFEFANLRAAEFPDPRTTTVVPVPAAGLLLAAAIGGLALMRRRKAA